MIQKDTYIEQGFADWSRRDFQQFVKALEAYGWYVVVINLVCFVQLNSNNRSEPYEVYAAEIQDKSAADVEKYYKAFQKKWKTLSGELICVSEIIMFLD